MTWIISRYDKSPREKVYTFREGRANKGEARRVKTSTGWRWRCDICNISTRDTSEYCEHIFAILRFIQAEKVAREERARRLDAMYLPEPAAPRRKFAPCPD